MKKLLPGLRICRQQSIVSKKIRGEWIILEPNKRYVRTFNEAAGYIWTLTQRPVTIQAVIDNVTKQYGIPPETAKRDVEEFIAGCINDHLLTVTEPL